MHGILSGTSGFPDLGMSTFAIAKAIRKMDGWHIGAYFLLRPPIPFSLKKSLDFS
jgi:hypothetical protein